MGGGDPAGTGSRGSGGAFAAGDCTGCRRRRFGGYAVTIPVGLGRATGFRAAVDAVAALELVEGFVRKVVRDQANVVRDRIRGIGFVLNQSQGGPLRVLFPEL